MQRFIAALSVFLAAVALAQTANWPSLPTDGYIRGRPATKADVEAGRAVFVAADGDRVIGRPLPITIPEYAYFLNEGKRVPAIVLQAEEARGRKLLGARLLTGDQVAGFISDFELLGTRAPSKSAP
jgi:hypothetical protein